MIPQEARALVAALPEALEHWLTKTVEGMLARSMGGPDRPGFIQPIGAKPVPPTARP